MSKTIHFIFWSSLVVVFGVLGWLTYSILDLDRQREQEFRQNALEEQTRLALWRMDSSLNSILFNENKRSSQDFFGATMPHCPEYVHTYFQITPQGTLFSCASGTGKHAVELEVLQKKLIPGILAITGAKQKNAASSTSQAVGKIPLPVARTEQAIQEIQENLVQQKQIDNELPETKQQLQANQVRHNLEQASKDYQARSEVNKLAQLVSNADSKDAQAFTPHPKKPGKLPAAAKTPVREETLSAEKAADIVLSGVGRSILDIDLFSLPSPAVMPDFAFPRGRGEIYNSMDEIAHDLGFVEHTDASTSLGKRETRGEYRGQAGASLDLREIPVSISGFSAYWIDGELILIRTVETPLQAFIQGVWFDWRQLADMLLDSATDILPDASLTPFTEQNVKPSHVTRLLAGVPMILSPGELSPVTLQPGFDMLNLSLILSWSCALLAVLGVLIMIVGMMRLNERRSTFVSSVTHELRTPLTTFNLYTEMFMNGMVPADKHKNYFSTLQQEASRLTHLVDNVLSFSRIEKSSIKKGTMKIDGETMLQHIMSVIVPVLRKADMVAEVDIAPGARRAHLDINIGYLEQIMVNLSDNAVKYASERSGDVMIGMKLEGNNLIISFRDFGPGICPAMQKRLFKPFSRSAEDAAGNKPGIGLGLALSREIARKLGGDLKLDRTCQPGTRFLLSIPLQGN